MSSAPTPPADDFPAGQTGDMRDVLLSPPTGAKPPTTPAGRWEPPSAEELQKLLPQYEITALLGRGGMGAVYKGRQIALDRPVAIKILSNQLEEADASFAERFKNEARALGKLSHPGIVGVYDFGEAANGLLYIVMEFIEGTDVAKMIAKEGRLHSQYAMAITAHVCDALAYAHARGIIHRDIKPANIMVGYDGVVKVADFGLAKMNHSQTTGLTRSGMAMGTLYYMAPEALMLGSSVDQRADIYAVGVMLYQMLTGKLPQGLFELPSLQIPGLDPRYDSIIGKALREDRELRYPNASDMRHDLDAILTQPVVKVEAAAERAPAALPTEVRPQRTAGKPYRSPASLPQPAPSKSSSGGMIAVVVLLVLAGAAFFYFRGGDRVKAVSSPTPPAGTGDWIDLLALVDPQSGTVSGKWTRVADGLHGERLPDTKGAQVFQLPYEPPEEYDFRVAYTTMEGNAEISQLLSAFDRQFTWGTASGQPEKWSGFNMVKGKPMMLSGAGVKLPGRRELNRRYESLVEVRRDRVTGYVDGEKLVEWKTDYSDFSADPEHTLPNALALGVGIWWSKTVFHDISVREVTGTGKRLSPPPAVAPRSSPPSGDPAKATKDQPFVNSLGMKFVPVPGTDVLMCIHETRRQDYMAYLAANPSIKKNLVGFQRDGTDVGSTDLHPVVNLTWDEIQAFCAWISQKDGRTYRLPTDHEWSWAVGIGDKENAAMLPSELAAGLRGVYPWGATWPPPPGSGNFSDASAAELLKIEAIPGYQDGFGGLAPVMSFPPNALGIHDLSGNVWEWCADWYDASKQTHALRGGSYRDGGVDKGNCLRSADRVSRTANAWGSSDGFRLVVETKPAVAASTPAVPSSVPTKQQVPVGAATSPPAAVGSPVLPTGPTTWTDTKGRSITATFKAIASGNVLLDIAGKVSPVPLNTLSAESQKLAQQMDAARKLADASDPAKATKQQPFINTLGMKFVPVPGTDILMCIHETRKQDYATYVGQVPGVNDNWTRAKSFGIPASTGDDHPVISISWDDAKAFAQWLSQNEKRVYRLPTDREWSHAIGIADREPAGAPPENLAKLNVGLPGWGGTPPPDSGNYSDETLAGALPDRPFIRGYRDGYVTTAPVMSFKPNALGIYDLMGNQWEFCEDWFNASQTSRTIRGGCYNDFAINPSARSWRTSNMRHESNGFRLVLELASNGSTETSAAPAAVPTSTLVASASAAATKDKPFTNTLGMKFVPVPGTKALFCIHETRRQDYTEFAAQNPGTDSAWKNALERGVPAGDRPDHPVVNVSWNEAQIFCAWLSKKENRTYRLPTDSEWSAAVGLADREPKGMTPLQLMLLPQNQDQFPWGTVWPPPKNAGNFSDTTASAMLPPEVLASSIDGYTDGFATTAPVMSFAPNRLGLYDLAGNVFEMVEDCMDATRTERVVRGHSYAGGNRRALLSSNRGTCDPNSQITRHGFRVVLDPVSAAVVPGSSAGAAPRTTITAAASAIRSITKDKPFTNTLGMKFVPVPGAKVLFSIWETRVQDYSVFARAEKVDDSWKNRQRNGIPVARDRDHPVVSVNWDEAQAFCRWLTDKEAAAGKLSKGWQYRLPKDEEWSIAVGLPPEQGMTPADKGRMNRSLFPWGSGFPPPNAKVGNYADTEWHDKFPTDSWLTGYTDGFATTAPVGSFPANIHGLHDLGGNVWEWCDDLLTGGGTKRVLRGGCWGNSSSDDLNSACRYFFSDPETHVHSYGFRCVLQAGP